MQISRSQHKMTQLFEIQTIEGKGVGFVATKDIKRGTVIFSESPQLDLALEEKGKIYVSKNLIINK